MSSNQVLVESDNLELILSLPNTNSGVVEFLKYFGQLYVGQVHPEFFKSTFKNLKLRILPWFADIANIQDDGNYRLGHKLDLCHQALESHWRSPCTATVVNGDVLWESGQSRILAGGICWQDPWKKHRLLILTPGIEYIPGYLTNATEIKSDCDLVEAFGSNGVNRLNTSLYVNSKNQLNFRIGAVKQLVTERDYMQDLGTRVDTVRNWVLKYPAKSKLDVYTDRPDLIKDSIGFWDIQHKGPGFSMNPLASIDSYLWQQSKSYSNTDSDGIHEFYVQNSNDVIDVAELLVWMDLSYTSYYTSDWRYVLRRQSGVHRAKMIGLSRNC